MEILLLLLCISGMAFFLFQANGPFNLMSKIRIFAFRLPLIGVMLYELHECPFCSGMHAGWITYLLYAPYLTWTPWELIIWAFAGGMSNLLLETWLSKAYTKEN